MLDTGKSTDYNNKTHDGLLETTTKSECIALGIVDNHIPFSKIGFNGNVTNTIADMSPLMTAYTFPTSGQQMMIQSSQVNDTSGTTVSGCHGVRITYLDTNYVQKNEDIWLSGTTKLTTTATDIFRVNNMRALSCGVVGATVGSIMLTNLGSTIIYGFMRDGKTRQRQMIYTVPSGQTLFINKAVFASTSSDKTNPVTFITKANYDEKIGSQVNYFQMFSEVTLTNQALDQQLIVPTKIPEKTDLRIQAQAQTGSAICECSLRGWLEW